MDQILARLAQKITLPLFEELQKLSRRAAIIGTGIIAFALAGFFFICAIFIYLSEYYSPLAACVIIGVVFALFGCLTFIIAYYFVTNAKTKQAKTKQASTSASAASSSFSDVNADSDAIINLAIPGLVARSLFAPLVKLLATVLKTMIMTSISNIRVNRSASQRADRATMQKPAARQAVNSETPDAKQPPSGNKKKHIARYAALALLGGLVLGGFARGERNKKT